MIVTFYSFKGGVGRSMALVNVGEILADWGYRVVLIDWDLEAPGLERYLAGTPQELERLIAAPGLVDLLEEYKAVLASPPAAADEADKDGVPGNGGLQTASNRPLSHTQVGSLLLRRPWSRTVPVSVARSRSGQVRLLTAGARHGEAYRRYADAVRGFDWNEFYEKWAGGAWIDFLRQDLESEADIVLVDSRTGVTEHGGVCTHHLADLAILFSASNEMNLEGTQWMATALSNPRLPELRGGRKIYVLPIAARVEQTAQVLELNEFRSRFTDLFAGWAPTTDIRPGDFFLKAEIPYIPLYSLKERIVAREPEGRREPKLYAAYETLADAIVATGVRERLLGEPPARQRVARAETMSASPRRERPAGRFVLSRDPEDPDLVAKVAKELRSAGVDLLDFATIDPPATWSESLRKWEEAQGVIVLIGRGGVGLVQKADVDFALRLRALQPHYRILPLLLPETNPADVPPRLALFPAVQLPEDLGATNTAVYANVAARLVGETAPFGVWEEPPFPGLTAFTEDQAAVFFGRDREVEKMVASIANGARWLKISGPSGIGATSVVAAGLVPALRRGEAASRRRWKVVLMRPGGQPLAALSTALYQPGTWRSPVELEGRLEGDDRALADAIRLLTADGFALLLVVDSLHELFVAAASDRVLERLDALLATAVSTGDLPLVLVTIVPNDFADRLAELRRLATAVTTPSSLAASHPIDRFGERELRQTIEGPAAVAGLTWEPGLPERVAIAALETPKATWLLAWMLQTLWTARDGTFLTNAAYQMAGGPAALLAASADGALEGLDFEIRQRVRRLLVALVEHGEGGEPRPRVITRVEAVMAAGGGADGERVLLQLSGAQDAAWSRPSIPSRLLTVDGGRVSLAHEALVRRWATMRRWVEEDGEMLRQRGELEAASLAWDAAGRPLDRLPRGRQLAELAKVPPALERSARFLVAAQERQRARRAQRVMEGAVLVLGAALLYYLGQHLRPKINVPETEVLWLMGISGALGSAVQLLTSFGRWREELGLTRHLKWLAVLAPITGGLATIAVWMVFLQALLRPDLDFKVMAAIGFILGMVANRVIRLVTETTEVLLGVEARPGDSTSRGPRPPERGGPITRN